MKERPQREIKFTGEDGKRVLGILKAVFTNPTAHTEISDNGTHLNTQRTSDVPKNQLLTYTGVILKETLFSSSEVRSRIYYDEDSGKFTVKRDESSS